MTLRKRSFSVPTKSVQKCPFTPLHSPWCHVLNLDAGCQMPGRPPGPFLSSGQKVTAESANF